MRYQPPDDAQRQEFHQGISRHAYTMFGAHPVWQDEDCWHFTVWAPNAQAVSLTGEFCFWEYERHPMVKQFDGTWEIRLPNALFTPDSNPDCFSYAGAEDKLRTYKYAIKDWNGHWTLKADPYAFAGELRPNTASLLYDLDGYEWSDGDWMAKRRNYVPYKSPVNIYELHLASWRRGENGRMLNYDEIADQLIPYIEEMGYTHVELMPVMEHPLDMSWGYQVTGYYAATARHGSPKQLMSFIDRMHQSGIGVILDWVPAHFPRDEIGLRRFDGSSCYEHEDPRRAEMPQWGTMMFDYARGEVCSFMLSNACFWLEVFHADGLRVDAVSSMLYHDFAREEGYLGNMYGGRENLEAIAFLKMLNQTVYRDFPGVMMIAEESSAFPKITHPVDEGGLGFGFKWNMGWMNDMLAYIKLDPVYRRWHHDKITFSLMYAFSENYILPFSHDEVVHGKKSMLDKQPGDLWQKFAGLRALYGYTMAHPGKKLLFMGAEFGHFIEWNFDGQLDWFLMVYERHPDLCRCVRLLNRFYREHPAFWQIEKSWDGFMWLTPDDKERSIVVFMRTDEKGNSIICMTNFTSAFYPQFRFGLPQPGSVDEVFNTDLKDFGGSNQYNAFSIQAEEEVCNGLPYSVQVCVPPMSTVYFDYKKQPLPKKPKETKAAKTKAITDTKQEDRDDGTA
ncbi:MAG: 1,4-alpha-glucan branching protein GlgB [Clostridiales bacterium]|nr:1,4-alpha-glucan branching protein GlgB [Clostridiales bacterium]